MNPHSPPTKLARFTELGTGRANWNLSCDLEGDRGDGSPPIALELELGLELGTGYTKRSCGFTFFQLQELQLQSLIYKYMEARLPVPSQLVVPIWKSVASSVSGLSGDLHELYPSFSGSGRLHFELKNGMDPEPGRCRRTDGKKWRCSKEAIPDHKYCERHVHRGRLRSRKLVEASLRSPITSSSTITSDANGSANTSLSISLPAVDSSSWGAGAGINPSPSFIFSPRSVLHDGRDKKLEPSF